MGRKCKDCEYETLEAWCVPCDRCTGDGDQFEPKETTSDAQIFLDQIKQELGVNDKNPKENGVISRIRGLKAFKTDVDQILYKKNEKIRELGEKIREKDKKIKELDGFNVGLAEENRRLKELLRDDWLTEMLQYLDSEMPKIGLGMKIAVAPIYSIKNIVERFRELKEENKQQRETINELIKVGLIAEKDITEMEENHHFHAEKLVNIINLKEQDLFELRDLDKRQKEQIKNMALRLDEISKTTTQFFRDNGLNPIPVLVETKIEKIIEECKRLKEKLQKTINNEGMLASNVERLKKDKEYLRKELEEMTENARGWKNECVENHKDLVWGKKENKRLNAIITEIQEQVLEIARGIQ